MTVEKGLHFPSNFTPIISKALYQTKIESHTVPLIIDCCGGQS